MREKSCKDIIKAVVYQPILPAFTMGLLLSVKNTGCPMMVDLSLEAVGLLFKPCLYFLIGLYTDVIKDFGQFKIVMTVLGLRYLFAGFVAVLIWLWFPFDTLERTTMALSFLSPVSTMTMYLVAEYGYPSGYVSMSATLTTISVFLSFIIQEAVMRSY
jgi:predicted permease